MTEGAEVSQKFPVVMGETQERAEFRNIPRRESLLDTLNFVRVDFETTRGNNMTQILDSLEAKFTLISIQTRAELAELPQDPIRKPVEGVGSRVPSFLGTLTTGEAHSDFSTGSRVPCLTARSRKSSTFDLNAKGTGRARQKTGVDPSRSRMRARMPLILPSSGRNTSSCLSMRRFQSTPESWELSLIHI